MPSPAESKRLLKQELLEKAIEELKEENASLLSRIAIIEEQVFGTLPPILAAPPVRVPQVIKKKTNIKLDFSVESLTECSHTELTQIAELLSKGDYPKLKGVGKNTSPEDIISVICGDDIYFEDPLSEAREKTFEYVKANERMLKSIVTCDLNCPECPHFQVAECWLINREKVEEFIQ